MLDGWAVVSQVGGGKSAGRWSVRWTVVRCVQMSPELNKLITLCRLISNQNKSLYRDIYYFYSPEVNKKYTHFINE